MALRDDLLPVFEGARQLVQDLGLRQHRAWAVADQWSEHVNLGTVVQSAVELLPRPKWEPTSATRGKLTKITPAYSGGGWEPADLLPAIASGKDPYFILRGPDLVDVPYALVGVESHKNFTFSLHLERLPRQAPDF